MSDRKIAGVTVFVSNETYDEYKETLQEQINNLQSKIDKAIEYINTHEYPSMYGLRENDLSKKELLDILKEDNNEN